MSEMAIFHYLSGFVAEWMDIFARVSQKRALEFGKKTHLSNEGTGPGGGGESSINSAVGDLRQLPANFMVREPHAASLPLEMAIKLLRT